MSIGDWIFDYALFFASKMIFWPSGKSKGAGRGGLLRRIKCKSNGRVFPIPKFFLVIIEFSFENETYSAKTSSKSLISSFLFSFSSVFNCDNALFKEESNAYFGYTGFINEFLCVPGFEFIVSIPAFLSSSLRIIELSVSFLISFSAKPVL